MRIDINARLRPFIHRPGARMLVPGTGVVAELFPTRVELLDLKGGQSEVREVELPGPALSFTAEQDLERGAIRVWGKTVEGHFRYQLAVSDGQIQLVEGRAGGGVQPTERLSLGSHKKLDWDLVCRRLDLCEILPVWLQLGAVTPEQTVTGGSSLLDDLTSAIQERDRLQASELLRALFRTGFEELMVPRSQDLSYLGYDRPPLSEGISPLALLTTGAALIRSLFIREDEGGLSLLPLLPREAVSGRFTAICCPYGEIDFEWTKRAMRRLVLRASHSGEVRFVFPKETKTFRLRRGKREAGERLDAGSSFRVSEGEILWLDRFQK